MAAETQVTANTGIGQAVTANSALDGSGTLATVLTGASNGTVIKSITVKAIMSTTEGMVRLFISDGSNNRLIEEIHVPANTVSGINNAFEYTFDCDYVLKSGWILKASTQTGDDFNIIAEGLNWSYFSGAVRPDSTNYNGNNGFCVISTANANRDGTGTTGTVITAGSSATYNGCEIGSVTIKATGNTTVGTVRLFLYDGGSVTRLLTEVSIPAIIQSATEAAFERTIDLGNFALQAGWSILASTENAETFVVSAEGRDWKYPALNYVTNFTPASGTNVTTEELLHSLQVPANVFATGDVFEVYASLDHTNGVGTKTFRMYINTSNSLSGATLLATNQVSTSGASGFSRFFPVINDTTVDGFGLNSQFTASQYTTATSTTSNITVPSISGGFWILISGQKSTGGNLDEVRWSMVRKATI